MNYSSSLQSKPLNPNIPYSHKDIFTAWVHITTHNWQRTKIAASRIKHSPESNKTKKERERMKMQKLNWSSGITHHIISLFSNKLQKTWNKKYDYEEET